MQTNKINEKNVENHEIHFEIRKLQFYLPMKLKFIFENKKY